MTINQASSNLLIEDSFTSIKATIYSRRKWGFALPSLSVFLGQALCILPILYSALMGYVQNNFSPIVQGIVAVMAFGLCLYLLYKQLLEVAEYAFTQEIVTIDNQVITIEKSGFLFLKTKKTFPAENVRSIFSSFRIKMSFSFLNRLPFMASRLGAFMIWHDRLLKPFYNFGNDISQSDAESFLESVYKKFPKYRYTGTT